MHYIDRDLVLIPKCPICSRILQSAKRDTTHELVIQFTCGLKLAERFEKSTKLNRTGYLWEVIVGCPKSTTRELLETQKQKQLGNLVVRDILDEEDS